MKRKNRKWPCKFVTDQVAIAGVSRECRARVAAMARQRGVSQGVIVECAIEAWAEREGGAR